MNEIIRHIEYLLVCNDCVVIPGLGAILAHVRRAEYLCDGQAIEPPCRTFSFNVALTHNDGLLVSSIARGRDITYEAALAIVTAGVDNMRRILSAENSLSLGLAGRLYQTGDGRMSFEPPTADALTPRFMWLRRMHLEPVEDLARRRASMAVQPVYAHRKAVNYLLYVSRVAASLALLVALGFMLSTPIQYDKAQYASLGIEAIAPASAVKPSNIQSRTSTPVTLYLYKHADAYEIVDTVAHAEYVRMRAAEKADAVAKAKTAEELRFEPSDNYYLIVASLATEADALEFISHSKYSQLGILAKDGRYRVYAATGRNLREAQAATSILADRFNGTWVCRK